MGRNAGNGDGGEVSGPIGDYGEALKAALAEARRLREALDAIEAWQAAAYVTQAEDRIEALIAHVSPPGA